MGELVVVGSAGISPRTVRRRVEAGEWTSPFPGVYWTGGELPAEKRLEAALLWAGEGALLSHDTAARRHGLDGSWVASPIHLSSRRKLEAPGVVAHRTKDLDHGVRAGRLRYTGLGRTLIDLWSTTSPLNVAIALEGAWERYPSLIPRLWYAIEVEELWAPAGFRALVEDCSRRRRPMSSPLELRYLHFGRERGFPEPICQDFYLDDRGAMYADFGYPDRDLVVEADGFRWHGGPTPFHQDATRRARFAAMGITHVSVTHEGLVKEPEKLEKLLREVFAAHPVRRRKPEIEDYLPGVAY